MSYPDSMRTLYRRPGFLLKRCHQVSVAFFLEECREFQMTPSQYGALYVLAQYPGIDQIALGRLTGLDRSTAGLVLKLLSQRGLIERAINPKDKRRMRLKLSKEGERTMVAMAGAAKRAQERSLAGLPKDKREQFLDILEAYLEGHNALIDVETALNGGTPE
ncbi:MAG: MarR family transcriptional regulator [Rhodospirillales bacterium]|nr:MarR family transcriptional regulator [Rhodospirillales bacterium]